MTITIGAKAAMDVDEYGTTHFAKNIDEPLHPASIIKSFTLWLARQWVPDEMLHETVEVPAAALVGGTTSRLQAGDIVSWNDLFYGLMLPSGNDAAHTIARHVGQMILDDEGATGDPLARFLAELGHEAATRGWSGSIFATPSGYPDNASRLTARTICDLAFLLDDYSVEVMGTRSHTMTITGPNARTYSITHTVTQARMDALTGHLGSKTGGITAYEIANLLLIWQVGGIRHAAVGLHSWPDAQRYTDMQAIQQYVLDPAIPSLFPDFEAGGIEYIGVMVGGEILRLNP